MFNPTSFYILIKCESILTDDFIYWFLSTDSFGLYFPYSFDASLLDIQLVGGNWNISLDGCYVCPGCYATFTSKYENQRQNRTIPQTLYFHSVASNYVIFFFFLHNSDCKSENHSIACLFAWENSLKQEIMTGGVNTDCCQSLQQYSPTTHFFVECGSWAVLLLGFYRKALTPKTLDWSAFWNLNKPQFTSAILAYNWKVQVRRMYFYLK